MLYELCGGVAFIMVEKILIEIDPYMNGWL